MRYPAYIRSSIRWYFFIFEPFIHMRAVLWLPAVVVVVDSVCLVNHLSSFVMLRGNVSGDALE